ncbi:Uncharacterised protein [Chromobacterium violaceum]|uniref:Uncharacterized protein n=1 Tax=Chromobacterium violaceum TaxID=536 RepID=A0A447T9G5_CHRVL|nr:Uncharacterised protein [Chromobacterium violaceum]
MDIRPRISASENTARVAMPVPTSMCNWLFRKDSTVLVMATLYISRIG